MKGQLYKIKNEWFVKYTTYKTIPGIKGVMGSHSRMPESNYLPIHPDHILHYIKDGDEFTTIDFEISEILTTDTDGTRMVKYAKLINEEKSTKRSKQKKYTNVTSENNIKKFYTEEDIVKAFQKGWESREPQYDGGWKTTLTAQDYIKSLNKQD